MDRKDNLLYEVRGKAAIITLNLPKQLNALDYWDYQKLLEYLFRAGREPNTLLTIIQSTGTFFSAGAKVDQSDMLPEIDASWSEEKKYNASKHHYRGTFLARNMAFTHEINEHPKVLIVALNGPVIGLSAAVVALADLVYATDNAYLLTPFANIGLVSEGATAVTLVDRLGWSLASEALLASKPIKAQRLLAAGFLNELYKKDQFKSTEEFNLHVYEKVTGLFAQLVPESVTDIKKLMKRSSRAAINDVNSEETALGLDRFARSIPQKRFAQLAAKSRRHKL